MSVRIRMKKMGRKHRPFYRVCAMDIRVPRDGRILEELGTYDPMVRETDARTLLNGERIKYWLSVGAQPSDKVSVLIKKYGELASLPATLRHFHVLKHSCGTHLLAREEHPGGFELVFVEKRRPK